VSTPIGIDKVDIVVSMGLTYSTSPNDAGEVWVNLSPHPGRKHHVMLRGPTPLATSHWTSTTLTWMEKRLPAQGQVYNLFLHAKLKDNGDHVGHIRTIKIVVIIDIRPSAPR